MAIGGKIEIPPAPRCPKSWGQNVFPARSNVGAMPDFDELSECLIGLGANLPSERFGPPVATLEAALSELERSGLRIVARSRWWESAPVPPSGQPWYVNGVVRAVTALDPGSVLDLLHRVEADFGRVRSIPNAARIIDLDLLAQGRVVRDAAPILPHPRLTERAFVLLPLREVSPGWRHPVSGEGIDALIAALPPGQDVRPIR